MVRTTFPKKKKKNQGGEQQGIHANGCTANKKVKRRTTFPEKKKKKIIRVENNKEYTPTDAQLTKGKDEDHRKKSTHQK